MANRHRGEITARIGGRDRTLCLTLGALAELEDAFQSGDLMALVQRLETGRFSARDLTHILGSGLRGAGETISNDEIARLAIDGGVARMAEIAVELLVTTFTVDTEKLGEADA